MKESVWPIYVHTQNRNNLKKGDKVVFYKAGLEGQKFLGTAKVASDLQRTTKIDYSIRLSDVKEWRKRVNIIDFIDSLDFILDKQSWGRFFQGGVRRISKKDYELILSKV